MAHFTESFSHKEAAQPAFGWTRKIGTWIAVWREKRKQRQEFRHMLTLDDRSLEDIGLTRSDVDDGTDWSRRRERLMNHHLPHV